MHKSSKGLAVHMHDCYGVHMHKDTKSPVQTGASPTPPAKKVVGGITLYEPQLAKLAAAGASRSAVIRKLIDEHL